MPRNRKARRVRSCLRTKGRAARHDRRWSHLLRQYEPGDCHYDKRDMRVYPFPSDEATP